MDPTAGSARLMFTMQANIDNAKKLNYVISPPLLCGGIIQRITFKFAASFEFNHRVGGQSTSKASRFRSRADAEQTFSQNFEHFEIDKSDLQIRRFKL
jgi:hypothetical protein